MTTIQTIEVEGLPEGWKPIRYGWPKKNIDYIFDGLGVKLFLGKEDHAMLIVEKIQPRRIVLVETGEERNRPRLNSYTYFYTDSEGFDRFKVLSQVKETDIPLNKVLPYLKLSVNDCKSLLSTNDNYAAYHKVQEFIKDK